MWVAIGTALSIIWFSIQRLFKWKDEKPKRDLQQQRNELERLNQQAIVDGNIAEVKRTRAALDKLAKESI